MSLDFTDSSHWYQLCIFVIIMNMLQYSISVMGSSWHWSTYAECQMYKKRHGGEINDILLFFVTNNCWTRSFTLGYWLFYFSSVIDSSENKNPCRKNTLASESACCLSTIIYIVDSQLMTVGSCIILNQVVVGSTMVRHMKLYYLYL
jgi:hypothetical protein